MDKERSEKNAAVISALDSLQNFAAKYQEKKCDKSEEEKKREEMIVKENVRKASKMTIQEQIAETLRLAKEKEAEKERVQREIKRNKEENEMIVSTIQEVTESEWLKFNSWDELVFDFHEEKIRMDILAQETQAIMIREEKKRQEKQQLLEMAREKERENQRLAEEVKMKAELEMKKKIMEELDKIRQLQEHQASKIREEEGKKKIEKEILLEKEAEELRLSQKRGNFFIDIIHFF